MDLDSFGPCHESEHIVTEHRIAALCHSVVDSTHILGIYYKYVVVSFFLNYSPDLFFLLFRLLLLGPLGETIINSTSADSFLLFSVENDRENARIIFGLSGCNSNSAIRAYLDNAPRDFAAASAVIRLSVIRHLTELLGGEFDAEIRQDGSFGIRISFLREELEDTDGDTAKRHHRAETIPAHTEKVRLPVPDGKKMQILIVPMDDADRMLLQLMLRNIPECEMVTADDITSAEAILSNGDTCFNAVIFDPAQNDPAPERKLEKLRSAAAKKTGFIAISSGDSFRHADVTLRKPLKYTVLLESVMFFRS